MSQRQTIISQYSLSKHVLCESASLVSSSVEISDAAATAAVAARASAAAPHPFIGALVARIDKASHSSSIQA